MTFLDWFSEQSEEVRFHPEWDTAVLDTYNKVWNASRQSLLAQLQGDEMQKMVEAVLHAGGAIPNDQAHNGSIAALEAIQQALGE